MPIVLLDHPSIGVPQLRGDDGEWYAPHGETRSIGVAEAMKVDRRVYTGRLCGRGERALLLGFGPGPPIASDQKKRASGPASGETGEKVASLLRQPQRVGASRSYSPGPNGPGIGVEVARGQGDQFAIAAAGEQRRGHQRAEIVRASIREALGLIVREIPQSRSIGFPKRAHGAPSVIAGTTPFPVRVI